jgi:2-polyprenyl-3-methyl-5-hydroxy-6-metoxy-1,4-benzoquinol methylase
VPDRNTFETVYAGQAPWDIGRPQQAFLDVADRITGSIRDAGCGTGDNALFCASRGHKVTGIDFLEEPIQRAKRQAAERGLTAAFLVRDALALKDLPELFDSVMDSGLCHVFAEEARKRYVAGLASVLRPSGEAVPALLQRRGAGHARATAGVEERGSLRRGGRERRSANGRPRRHDPRLSPFSFGHSLALGPG